MHKLCQLLTKAILVFVMLYLTAVLFTTVSILAA
jgi:hypothetical protein